jgi:hypothetical protein
MESYACFDPEDGGDILLLTVAFISTDYTALLSLKMELFG